MQNVDDGIESCNGLDRIRLAHVMARTAADHNGEVSGEAMNAIGVANRMLKGAGLTWGELLADRPDGSPMVAALMERNADLDSENRRLRARLAKLSDPPPQAAADPPPKPKRKPRRKKAKPDDGRGELVEICNGVVELGEVVCKAWPVKFCRELKAQIERGGQISVNQRAKLFELRDAWLGGSAT